MQEELIYGPKQRTTLPCHATDRTGDSQKRKGAKPKRNPSKPSDVLGLASPEQDENAKRDEAAEDGEERCKRVFQVLEGNFDVHAKQAADEIHRHQNGRQECDLAQHTIGVGTLLDVVDRELREVVAVGSGQYLLEMAQVGNHCDDVILDVTQIHADIHARGHLVVLVATLGKATENIGLATQQTHESKAILARPANTAQEGVGIILACHEDLVLNGIGLKLKLADDGGEGVHNVIAVECQFGFFPGEVRSSEEYSHQGIANPVAAQRNVVLQKRDPPAHVGGMGAGLEAETESTLAEHDNINVEGLVLLPIFLLDDLEGAEASKVVRREKLNLFARLLSGDVLDGEGVNAERLAESSDLLPAGFADVQPPNSVRFVSRQGEKPTDVFSR